MTDVPESAAAVARRMQAWQEGHLSGVDSAVILGAVRDAVNEASASLRAVREWCDKTAAAASTDQSEPVFQARMELVDEVRALLPDVPPAAGEVAVIDRDA